MAIVTQHKSEIPSAFPTKPIDAPRVEANNDAEAESTYRPHDAEAPDRGYAGETAEGRMGEAPDAGDGRAGYVENEFTHGRSQS